MIIIRQKTFARNNYAFLERLKDDAGVQELKRQRSLAAKTLNQQRNLNKQAFSNDPEALKKANKAALRQARRVADNTQEILEDKALLRREYRNNMEIARNERERFSKGWDNAAQRARNMEIQHKTELSNQAKAAKEATKKAVDSAVTAERSAAKKAQQEAVKKASSFKNIVKANPRTALGVGSAIAVGSAGAALAANKLASKRKK